MQTPIRTGTGFQRLAPPHRVATRCTGHCSTCDAQAVRTMLTRRHPRLPPTFIGSPNRVPTRSAGNYWRGLRSLPDLTEHLTTRADDSHAAPVSRLPEGHPLISQGFRGCQGLVRFFALLRINPHAPPLVRVPVNSFEFQPCGRTSQAAYLTR